MLFAHQNAIIYINVNDHGVTDDSKIRETAKNFVEVEIEEEQMSYLNLNPSYKIVVIQEIGNEMSAIVVEH